MNAITRETSKAIIKDLDNEFFLILVDESHDISVKEQMALVLRYVIKKGIIIERFLGIVHVGSNTALSLKYAIKCLLCEHNLSLLKLRGQGYDGVSKLAKKLVNTGKHETYPLVYLFKKLDLTLPVVTTIVERSF